MTARRRELAEAERQLEGLIAMMIDGFRAPGLQERLDGLTANRDRLRAEVATLETSQAAPVLHPNLSEVYRARVARLREGLAAAESREVLEIARALIARLEVHPPVAEGERARLELVGELSAMLAMAGVEGVSGNAKSPLTDVSGLCGSVSVDAGTRNPRSQYVEVAI